MLRFGRLLLLLRLRAKLQLNHAVRPDQRKAPRPRLQALDPALPQPQLGRQRRGGFVKGKELHIDFRALSRGERLPLAVHRPAELSVHRQQAAHAALNHQHLNHPPHLGACICAQDTKYEPSPEGKMLSVLPSLKLYADVFQIALKIDDISEVFAIEHSLGFIAKYAVRMKQVLHHQIQLLNK